MRKAAITVDLAGMQPVINHADAQEQRAGNQTMAEHHDQGAFDALLVKGEQTTVTNRHMRDRRIGNQLLHIVLHQRNQRGVDYGDHRQAEDQPDEVCADASGNIGSEKRRKPYPPIFSSTPARITEPAVGACTCASGSQVWTGHIGIFTAKLAKNASQSQVCACDREIDIPSASGCRWCRRIWTIHSIAISISTEPSSV